MEVPFMRSYALALVKACYKRGAPAIGGMSALIPIKNDPVANDKAMAGIRNDKARDARDGFDGGWVAHPGLVELAMEERSEEHTSELQSLMRISYAVFCLKKNNK